MRLLGSGTGAASDAAVVVPRSQDRPMLFRRRKTKRPDNTTTAKCLKAVNGSFFYALTHQERTCGFLAKRLRRTCFSLSE